MPYDVCPRTYAGTNSDIIHWEQTYNCGFGSGAILEQFVRQSLSLPSQPMLVFSDSYTSTWRAKDCASALSINASLSIDEKESLLKWKQPGGVADIVENSYKTGIYSKVTGRSINKCLSLLVVMVDASYSVWISPQDYRCI